MVKPGKNKKTQKKSKKISTPVKTVTTEEARQKLNEYEKNLFIDCQSDSEECNFAESNVFLTLETAQFGYDSDNDDKVVRGLELSENITETPDFYDSDGEIDVSSLRTKYKNAKRNK